jgi:hypothetical protein
VAPSIAVTALETRLAQVFLTELVGPRPDGSYAEGDDTQVDIVLLDPDEQTDYEAYELVFTPVSDLDVTLPIARVRDTTQDTIATVEFVRESLDPNTVPFPRSAPYELIDIQDSSVPVERIVVREAPPATLSVSLEWFASDDDVMIDVDDIGHESVRPSHAFLVFLVLATALAVGVSVALFAI